MPEHKVCNLMGYEVAQSLISKQANIGRSVDYVDFGNILPGPRHGDEREHHAENPS